MADNAEQPAYKGTLYVLRKKEKTLRYFVLYEDRLDYFHAEADFNSGAEARGIIKLPEVKELQDLDSTKSGQEGLDGFEIILVSKKSLSMCGGEGIDIQEWKAKLKEKMQKLKEESAPSEAVCKGILTTERKGKVVQRYFAVAESSLDYYDSEEAFTAQSIPRGSIPFREIASTENCEAGFKLTIEGEKRPLELKTDNADEWISALQGKIGKAKPVLDRKVSILNEDGPRASMFQPPVPIQEEDEDEDDEDEEDEKEDDEEDEKEDDEEEEEQEQDEKDGEEAEKTKDGDDDDEEEEEDDEDEEEDEDEEAEDATENGDGEQAAEDDAKKEDERAGTTQDEPKAKEDAADGASANEEASTPKSASAKEETPSTPKSALAKEDTASKSKLTREQSLPLGVGCRTAFVLPGEEKEATIQEEGQESLLCRGHFNMKGTGSGKGLEQTYVLLYADRLEQYASQEDADRGAKPQRKILPSDVDDVEVEDHGFEVLLKDKSLVKLCAPEDADIDDWTTKLTRVFDGGQSVASTAATAGPFDSDAGSLKGSQPFTPQAGSSAMDKIIHKGTLKLVKQGVAEVNNFVVYPGRFEYSPAGGGSRGKETVLAGDIEQLQVLDSGLLFVLQKGRLDLRIPTGESLDDWVNAFQELLEYEDEDSQAPKSPASQPRSPLGLSTQWPEAMTDPEVGQWLAGLREQPLHTGHLGFQVEGKLVTKYCVLFQDRLDAWESPSIAAKGGRPGARVNLAEVRSVETVGSGFVLNCRGHKTGVHVGSNSDLHGWARALLSIIAPPPGQYDAREGSRSRSRSATPRSRSATPPPGARNRSSTPPPSNGHCLLGRPGHTYDRPQKPKPSDWLPRVATVSTKAQAATGQTDAKFGRGPTRMTMFTARSLGVDIQGGLRAKKPRWTLNTHKEGNDGWNTMSRRVMDTVEAGQIERAHSFSETALSKGRDVTGRFNSNIAGKVPARDPEAVPVRIHPDNQDLLISGKVTGARSPTPPPRELTGKITKSPGGGGCKDSVNIVVAKSASPRMECKPITPKIGGGREIFPQKRGMPAKVTDRGRDPTPRGRARANSMPVFTKVGEVGRIPLHETGGGPASTDRLRSMAEVSARRAQLRR